MARKQSCRAICPISQWYNNGSTQSRGLEASRDLAVRRLTAKWITTPETSLKATWPELGSIVKNNIRHGSEENYAWSSAMQGTRGLFYKHNLSGIRVCISNYVFNTFAWWHYASPSRYTMYRTKHTRRFDLICFVYINSPRSIPQGNFPGNRTT